MRSQTPTTPIGSGTCSAPAGTAARRTAGRPRSAARRGRSTSGRATTTSTSSPRSSPTSTGITSRVQESFDEILRFWLERGVDGFRIDVAHALFKDQSLPEMVEPEPRPPFGDWLSALMQPELHPLYRRWRAIADEFPGDRMYVSEIVVENQETIASYVQPDQLHLSFDFTLLHEQWDAERMRATIDRVLTTLGPAGAPATWVLREPRRHAAADPLRRRRARPAAGAGGGIAALRPARSGVHLPGPGARARGDRRPRRGAPGSDLPPHRRRPEGSRRLPGAAPLDERAAGVRLHRRRAVAADAGGLGPRSRSRRRSATPARRSRSSARRCGCGRAAVSSPGTRARGER